MEKQKNYGVSNKARLLNITRQTEGQTYMVMWRAFLRKMKYPVAFEFGEVMGEILPVLQPMWDRLR